MLFAGLSTCDPGNILDTIKVAKQQRVRVSVIGLAAEVHICRVICDVGLPPSYYPTQGCQTVSLYGPLSSVCGPHKDCSLRLRQHNSRPEHVCMHSELVHKKAICRIFTRICGTGSCVFYLAAVVQPSSTHCLAVAVTAPPVAEQCRM